MRVTRSEHPERIGHFEHIGRAERVRAHCGAECPGTGQRCSRERGHPDPHGRLRRVEAAWEGPAPGRELTKSPIDPGYRGPRIRGDDGLGSPFRGLVDRFFASFPETVMLILFLCFAVFSVIWGLQVL